VKFRGVSDALGVSDDFGDWGNLEALNLELGC
jgi:hypothetical protein